MSADGEVEDDEERLIEDRFTISVNRVAGDRVMSDVIDEEAHSAGIPLDSENVVVGKRTVHPLAVDERGLSGIAGTVYRRAGGRSLAALVLHDVQLAGGRPPRGGKILAEHPEGGPESLPRWQPNPCFDSTWLGENLSPRGDLPRSVHARPVKARQTSGRDSGDDHQLALPVQRDVARRVGVVLLLIVAVTAIALGAAVSPVVIPLRLADACSRWPVEFITPHLGPFSWRGRRRLRRSVPRARDHRAEDEGARACAYG